MSYRDWEDLADQVSEDLYKEVKEPKRSPYQKMRDLINDMEYSKKLKAVQNGKNNQTD